MHEVPKDPAILLSFVNTKLRNEAINLDDFCATYQIEKETIKKKLAVMEYYYDDEDKQFITSKT